MKAPCKDCESRASGCHSVCEKYAAYRESLALIRKERQKRFDADAMRAEAVYKVKKRIGGVK